MALEVAEPAGRVLDFPFRRWGRDRPRHTVRAVWIVGAALLIGSPRPVAGVSDAPVRVPQAPVRTADPVPRVRAVLFYSPTCPHCRDVIEDHLPPLLDRYGDRLRIVGVSTVSVQGQSLYQAMVNRFELPRERVGVPALVVGSTVLVGSAEIPDRLPGITERGLADGGIDWPAIPGLQEALVASGIDTTERQTAPAVSDEPALAGSDEPAPPAADPAPADDAGEPTGVAPDSAADSGSPAPATIAPPAVTPSPAPAAVAPGESVGRPAEMAAEVVEPNGDVLTAVPRHVDASVWDRFSRDPVANSAAVAVLLGLLAALGVGAPVLAGRGRALAPRYTAVVPVLAVVGLGIASYLAYIETTGVEAVCGPVGDCNTVQQSRFARMFGVLPVGVLGASWYAAVLAAWGAARARGPSRHPLWLGLRVVALIATLFSLYLTFLEPFVIGATCLWCLSSAIVTALILLTLSNPGHGPYPIPTARTG
jgi:uncharacterized membrane protein/thiol-disulfide isomerase/thioredoxin